MSKNRLIIFIFFFFFLLGLMIRVYKLNQQPFSDWDEGIYAQVAKEIIKNKSLRTTFDNQIWLNKPPLSHLLIALVFSFTNYSQFYSRLIFVVFSFFTLLYTYKVALKIFPQSSILILSPLFLLASELYLERSTILNTDIIIAFSWIGYVYYINSFWKKIFFLLLGVWSKSLVGFYPLFFELIYFFYKKNYLRKEKIMNLVVYLNFAILLASLWYLWAYLKFGNYFLEAHFYDQILKRVEKPIELHFGENLGIKYYPLKLFDKAQLLTIFLFIGYFSLLMKLFKLINKEKTRAFFTNNFLPFLYFLFPLPFLIFLLFGKSKIYWYLIFPLPFLALTATFPFYQLKKTLRKIAFLLFFVILIFSFVEKTYLYKPPTEKSESHELALCLKKSPFKKVAYLVDVNQRNNYQFIKNHQLDTKTSFIYGGSPAFFYYADKDIDFFYNVSEFKKKYLNYPIVVLKEEDRVNEQININNYNIICQTKNLLHHERWYGFRKKD